MLMLVMLMHDNDDDNDDDDGDGDHNYDDGDVVHPVSSLPLSQVLLQLLPQLLVKCVNNHLLMP